MLTNKKIGIRVFALVLALLMTVAVFAGCSAAEDEQARADAEAAQKAAEEAKKSADSLAKDLAEKLDELNKALDKVNDNVENVGDKVEQGDKDLQGQIDKWHNGETTEDPDAMKKPEQNQVTGEVSEKVLAQFTELKNKFLVTQKTWYTTENLAALNEIFEKASFELYRVTTSEGVEALLAETEAEASAVANIVSDANAVQALIAKFGDVPTTLYTTNEGMVKEARAAFDKWVNDYATCFFTANGFTTLVKKADGSVNVSATGERKLADFARNMTGGKIYIDTNNDTNSLLYAEAKLEALYAYAADAIKAELAARLVIEEVLTDVATATNAIEVLFKDDATKVEINAALAHFKTVKAIADLDNYKKYTTYADCKANAKIIEDCYEQYRIFWNANGGDDTPIKDGYGLLTGEQFVSVYVLCLYDGELVEYENLVFEYMLDYFVPYFMNTNNASALKAQTNWNYLSLNTTYAQGYDSNDYWSALNTTDAKNVTFAVETDRVNVWANNTVVASFKAHGEEIERELRKAVAGFDKAVLGLDYSSDFKGKKTLEEAFAEIDQIAAETVVDMVNVWYELVFTPYIETYSDALLATYKTNYGYAGSDVYAKHDNSFYTQVSNLIVAANDKLESVEFKSLEALGISNQRIFTTKYTNYAISGIDFNTTTGNKDASKNSAFVSIIENAYKTLDAAILAYDNVLVDVAAAETVHNKATAYAKELDELVGIGKLDNKTWKWSTASQLIDDYGAKYELVVGKDNYKVEEVYNKLTAARDTAVADILSVKLLNDDGTLAIDKESYAAANDKGKTWYHANTDKFGEMTLDATKDSKKNYAVQVVVDPEIVAEYIMVEKFAKGADAVVLAFCDATREIVKTALTADLEFYADKYSFGNLDYVKLEPDMKSFIAYLEGLTEFAGLGSKFQTASFGLKNQALDKTATGIGDDEKISKTSDKVTTWTLHINAMAKSTDDITGLRYSTDKASWYVMTKANLDNYFEIKNGTIVEDGLNAVRELSYKKDNLKNSDMTRAIEISTPGKLYSSINSLYAQYTGTVKDGKFIVEPMTGYSYDLNNERTALYLYRLAEVKDAVIAKVAAVNLITGIESGKDVAGAKAAALAELEAIMDQYNNPVPQTDKKTVALDDLSLPIAYQRYYTTQYDWTLYRQ